MVGHEAVGVHSKAVSRRQVFPQDKIELVVLGFDKTGFAVVTALNHMIGQTRKVHSCTTRHGNSLGMTEDVGMMARLEDCLKFNPSVPYSLVPYSLFAPSLFDRRETSRCVKDIRK